jgi:hypothetical protein
MGMDYARRRVGGGVTRAEVPRRMSNEVRVSSWGELHDRLYEGSWHEPLGRFRSRFAFRGVFDVAADLTTSLCRLQGGQANVEGQILRAFRKYAQRDSVPGDSVWNWLALAQHHGLPTRLLDWTFSPYVALHFSTYDPETFHMDGAVWCVDYVGAHRHLPQPLRDQLAAECADVFTTEMVDRVAGSLPAFDELGNDRPFVLFLEPPSLDERIVNQFALFSLMSSPTADMQDWLSAHPGLCHRLIIPAELKWEIRDKLDQANINERVLFPGLDGLSRYLKRYYTPKR